MKASFGNEHLNLDLSSTLGHPCHLSIGAWSQGLTAKSFNNNEIGEIHLSDIGDWLLLTNDPAVSIWKATIPTPLLRAINSIPSHKTPLLVAASKSTKFFDLLVNNAVLAWQLLDRKILNPLDNLQLEQFASKKQRDLCRFLGLSGSAQQIKILRRADTLQTTNEMRMFISVLNNPSVCKYLSHSKHIDPSIIRVVSENEWLVLYPSRRLIPFLADHEIYQIFNDTLRMLHDLGRMRQISCVNSLRRLHDRLTDEVNDSSGKRLIRDEKGDPRPLSTPPISGTEDIQPVTSQMDLIKEGREMRHCIASYLANAVSGGFYVYRMNRPERLTIAIATSASGHHLLKEVRGKNNKKPSAEAIHIIQCWLAENEPQSHHARPNQSPIGRGN